MKSIYKTPAAKQQIMALYEARLAACQLPWVETQEVNTFAGPTHVTVTGNPSGPTLLVLHGIHAGAPMTLEAMGDLLPHYRIVAVDTIGQATKSAETSLPLKDNSYGRWLEEVLDGLGLATVKIVGVSYGGFILQRLIAHAPHRIEKAVLVVPMGLVKASPFRGAISLSVPLLRFMISKKEKHLRRFMSAFYENIEQRDVDFQSLLLQQVRMDYRRPPVVSAEEGKGLKAPISLILSGEDVFIPPEAALKRFQRIYPSAHRYHIIKDLKHIPSPEAFSTIAGKIHEWMQDGSEQLPGQ